jgi:hypothetical protein
MRGLAIAFVVGVENIDECCCDAIPIRVGSRGRALGRERDRQLARPRTNQPAPLQPSGIRVAASASVPVGGADLHMQTGVLARLVLGPATGDERASDEVLPPPLAGDGRRLLVRFATPVPTQAAPALFRSPEIRAPTQPSCRWITPGRSAKPVVSVVISVRSVARAVAALEVVRAARLPGFACVREQRGVMATSRS